ncbi:site-specific integrase [Marinobacter changyiensis]|uniref:site-specific integrase n=1 Tax=Marinobacter changyiensis TaxID=2604091 RepID=UPI0012642E4F|nr:site-specific integrase [Marinobacter changyiensis]
MKIEKKEVSYRSKGSDYKHHAIYLLDGTRMILLSPFNLFLKDRATSSIKTSERYAGNICTFLNFILDRYHADSENFWLNASVDDLREWQQQQVRDRQRAGKTKPSDKTISINAFLIHDVYNWLKLNGFPISMHLATKEWVFNFKSESMLAHVRSQISGTTADHSSISAGLPRQQDVNKNDMTIMSNWDIERLMAAYKDPVYSVCFLLALATGMREEGICKIPFIGTGENIHIRPYPEILNEIGDAKTFNFTVTEKNKTRNLKINVEAWAAVCDIYLAHYYKRRKLLKKKHPEIPLDSVFFINRTGHPVTPKMISNMTYHAKQELGNFPWSFHSSRSWYATRYMINHLSKDQINSNHYNAAVEDGLRRQIGHSDIKTTYQHYIRMATLALAVQEDSLGERIYSELADISERATERFFDR